ncbi:MAG: MBL fold metallo-hydrolase [Prevotella sp.]|nr:MBL fold metallo-hydrolase [Prevotella sp.]
MKNKIIKLLAVLGLLATTNVSAAPKSDTFQTPGGKTVVINHIKHASIHIQYDDMNIYVDPVGTNVEPRTDMTMLPSANLIVLTHEHMDHYDHVALSQLWTPGTVVYANHSVIDKIHRGVTLANGDSAEYRGVKVKAVPAYNTTASHLQFHPQGRDNGYIIDLDGLRIYVAGDTEDIPEMAQLGPIDIAFLPCNQPYTMTVDQLERAARTIQPRVLFPYHYGDTPIAQIRMRLAGSGIDVRIRDYK